MAKVKYGMLAEKMAARWKSGKIPGSIKVGQGDSYYRIAENVYGDQKYGDYLEDYYSSKPLHPGMKLRMPKLPMRNRRARYRPQAPTTRPAPAPTTRP